MFVDDYRDALEMWALYLRTLGFGVETASDGPTAVAIATATQPDVIVLDLLLPGLGGCEVARRLHDQPATRSIPLIATTGSTQPEDLRRAREAGFAAIVPKPCDPPALVAAIEQALTGGTAPVREAG